MNFNLKKYQLIVVLILFLGNIIKAQDCPIGIAFCDKYSEPPHFVIHFAPNSEIPENITVVVISNNSTHYLTNIPNPGNTTQHYTIDSNNFPCASTPAASDYIISYTLLNGDSYSCNIVDSQYVPEPYDPECPTMSQCYNNQLTLFFPNAYFPSGAATFYFPNNPEFDGVYYGNQFIDPNPNTLTYVNLPCDNNFTVVFDGQECVIKEGVLCEGCTPYFGPDCNAIFDECGETIIQYVEDTYGTGCKVWEGDCTISNDIYRRGGVAIGTKNIPNGFSLAVNGGILTEQFKVCNTKRGWCDYVFEKDYDLLTLKEVEEYIKLKGHLHKTPSAKDIEKSGGIDLLDATLDQQEKIEELFLHLIELDKQLKELEENL